MRRFRSLSRCRLIHRRRCYRPNPDLSTPFTAERPTGRPAASLARRNKGPCRPTNDVAYRRSGRPSVCPSVRTTRRQCRRRHPPHRPVRGSMAGGGWESIARARERRRGRGGRRGRASERAVEFSIAGVELIGVGWTDCRSSSAACDCLPGRSVCVVEFGIGTGRYRQEPNETNCCLPACLRHVPVAMVLLTNDGAQTSTDLLQMHRKVLTHRDCEFIGVNHARGRRADASPGIYCGDANAVRSNHPDCGTTMSSTSPISNTSVGV